MKSKSLFKVSILGLGHSQIVSIRQHVTDILAGGEIDWVGANDGNLDFLIVNADFIDASSVQNLIRNNSIPVLLADSSVKEDHNDKNTIALPIIENTRLKSWIYENVLNKLVSPIRPTQIQESVIPRVLTYNAEVFEYLRTTHDGYLHLSDPCGAVGTIDAANQLIYLISGRRVPLDMQGRLVYEHLPHFSSVNRPIDLLQWFWDVAWLDPNCAVFIPPNQMVKLKFWPQPSNVNERKDMLLMSAKLAQNVASAEDLAKGLNIPIFRAQKFISALVLAGFAEKHMDGLPTPTKQKKMVNEEETTGFRGLLRGLRRRLGI